MGLIEVVSAHPTVLWPVIFWGHIHYFGITVRHVSMNGSVLKGLFSL